MLGSEQIRLFRSLQQHWRQTMQNGHDQLESWHIAAKGDVVLLHAEGFPVGRANICNEPLSTLPSSFRCIR